VGILRIASPWSPGVLKDAAGDRAVKIEARALESLLYPPVLAGGSGIDGTKGASLDTVGAPHSETNSSPSCIGAN
jgi:hypothetical protein